MGGTKMPQPKWPEEEEEMKYIGTNTHPHPPGVYESRREEKYDPELDEYEERGLEIGKLVSGKQKQYGDSAGKSGRILALLYPDGISPHRYDDALLTVRVLDKLSRVSQRGEDGKDLGGESPWQDIAGYGLLGWRKDENR